MEPAKITIQAVIHAPVEKVWQYWNEPDHITKWNHASDDWHSPMQKMICEQVADSFSEWKQKTGVSGLILAERMMKSYPTRGYPIPSMMEGKYKLPFRAKMEKPK